MSRVVAIKTGKTTSVDFPRTRVYVANQLGTFWDEVDYLYCDSLKVAASPEVDTAELSYLYGPLCREPRGDAEEPDYEGGNKLTLYPPLDVVGKFCKVVIEGAGHKGGADLTWYGIIEIDSREPDGSGSNSLVPNAVNQDTSIEASRGEPRGRQKLTAFGLIRLLELTTVLSSVVNQAQTQYLTGDTVTIGTGLPFNSYKPGEYHDRGNRSTLPSNIAIALRPEIAGTGDGTATGTDAAIKPDSSYVFSDLPQRTRHWNAAQAVNYLINNNAPQDASGTPITKWMLTAGRDDLDATQTIGWFDITVPTDGRNLKHILDELIGRKHGLGWYVTFSEDGAASESGVGSTGADSASGNPNGVATINVFSFNNTILKFGAGFGATTQTGNDTGTQANPKLRSLDFENAFDVTCQLTNSITAKYDRVVAIGAYKTSTFTIDFSQVSLDQLPIQIQPDWTSGEEELYKDAASGSAGYGGLSLAEQSERNRACRDRDQIRHVYRRFELSDAWAHTVFDVLLDDPASYLIAPLYKDDGTVFNLGTFNKNTNEQGDPIWTKGLKLLPKLPFKDRFDYSGSTITDKKFDQTTLTGEDVADIDGEPAYLKPFFFVPTFVSETKQRYEYLDRLAGGTSFSSLSPSRHWSANVTFLDQRPAFEINVSGEAQHFIAVSAFAGASATDPLHDPAIRGGLDWTQFKGTIAVQLFDRVTQESDVDPDDPGVFGKIERVLYIHVPDARLDYVVPNTVVRIDDGLLQQSPIGGFVRDDRPRLATIARSAAEWYGRTRQTIELKLKQVHEVVKLGWLITDVGPNYQLSEVNTPITSCAYDLLHGTTTFRTSHAEVEFEIYG